MKAPLMCLHAVTRQAMLLKALHMATGIMYALNDVSHCVYRMCKPPYMNI